jgi:hypothetical protein
MTHLYEPFTPDLFRQQTGLEATQNEAIYLRWVNTQVNYANFKSLNQMSASMKDIIELLKTAATSDRNF